MSYLGGGIQLRRWLLTGALCCALMGASHAQVESQEPEIPTITLSVGDTSGKIDEEVAVPIEVTANANLREPFKVVLRFPPSSLQFTRLGFGPLLGKADWKLESELRTSPAAFDMSFLEISVEPGEGDFFPEGGLIAYAYFIIVATLPDHLIELSPSLRILDGESPVQVETAPAEIMAFPEAMTACLFYMH